MKAIIYIGFCLGIFLLAGCFEDKGNYNYDDLGIVPQWLVESDGTPIQVSGREGELIEFRVQGEYFTFGQDSIPALDEFRYEWELNGTVFSRECDFDMLTDSIMKITKQEKYEEVTGALRLINTKTGATYVMRVIINFSAKYTARDVLVLSENGNNSRCSYLRLKSRQEGGKTVYYFDMEQNAFENQNGYVIPGKARRLITAKSPQISSSLGANIIVTDQVSYVINNESIRLATELKNEFLDGEPENFSVVDVVEWGRYTFIATEDGRLFKRQMSENFLSGKFLTEPYYVDNKGYRVTRFGHSAFDVSRILFLDELNRRILALMIDVDMFGKSNASVRPLLEGDGNMPVALWNLPQDIEVLYICQSSQLYDSMDGFVIYFVQNGVTYRYKFQFDSSTMKIMQGGKLEALPVNFDRETVFLVATSAWYAEDALDYLVYSKGNELRYLNYNTKEEGLLATLDATITSLAYETYSYQGIFVGCANGDVREYRVNWGTLDASLRASVNVGGKVIMAHETGAPDLEEAY
ncbi:MAG: hypothetical protein KH111_05120 [Bacteroidales bacterium]|nr:hypothetical protein [Bacteroidales bacterium]